MVDLTIKDAGATGGGCGCGGCGCGGCLLFLLFWWLLGHSGISLFQ